MAIDIRPPSEPEAPRSVLAEDGALSGQGPELPPEDLLALYGHMRMARQFDAALGDLLRQGRLGFHLSGEGEEAVSAATAYVLGGDDWLFPAFRDMPAFLVRGVPLEVLAHQAFGTALSPTLGRGLPLYFADRERRIGMSGAGGAAHLPHAVGAAWAAALADSRAVALASFNHGAASSGEFHAALNFAGVFKAPVVFVCRRRTEGPADPLVRPAGVKAVRDGNAAREAVVPGADVIEKSIAPRAKGYGLPGIRVDGTDFLALVSVLRPAIDRARAGEGPTLIEALTGGRDPLELLRRHLVHRGIWDEKRERASEATRAEVIFRAIRAAAAAGPPPSDTLWT